MNRLQSQSQNPQILISTRIAHNSAERGTGTHSGAALSVLLLLLSKTFKAIWSVFGRRGPRTPSDTLPWRSGKEGAKRRGTQKKDGLKVSKFKGKRKEREQRSEKTMSLFPGRRKWAERRPLRRAAPTRTRLRRARRRKTASKKKKRWISKPEWESLREISVFGVKYRFKILLELFYFKTGIKKDNCTSLFDQMTFHSFQINCV